MNYFQVWNLQNEIKKKKSVQEMYPDWLKEEGTSSLSGQFLPLALDLDCCGFCISQAYLTWNFFLLVCDPSIRHSSSQTTFYSL